MRRKQKKLSRSQKRLKTTLDLHNTMDATKWSAEFINIVGEKIPEIKKTEYSDWINGWFCNALMCGYDWGGRKPRDKIVRKLNYEIRRNMKILDKINIKEMLKHKAFWKPIAEFFAIILCLVVGLYIISIIPAGVWIVLIGIQLMLIVSILLYKAGEQSYRYYMEEDEQDE